MFFDPSDKGLRLFMRAGSAFFRHFAHIIQIRQTFLRGLSVCLQNMREQDGRSVSV